MKIEELIEKLAPPMGRAMRKLVEPLERDLTNTKQRVQRQSEHIKKLEERIAALEK